MSLKCAEGGERKFATDDIKLKKSVEADTRTPVRKLIRYTKYIKIRNFNLVEYSWKGKNLNNL